MLERDARFAGIGVGELYDGDGNGLQDGPGHLSSVAMAGGIPVMGVP